MKIFSLDTSNDSTSVSVLEDKKVLGNIFLNSGLIHSRIISQIVEKLFNLLSLKMKNIDLLTVCNGPGSFTGIRIGLSFMKGISLALNIPCVGVSSLESLAYSVAEYIDKDSVIYSCIKANKDEIYFNSYFLDNGILISTREDTFISFDDIPDFVKKERKKVVFVGNASQICYNHCSGVPGVSIFHVKEINSDYVGLAGLKQFLEKDFVLKANYLKKTRAEVNVNV